MNMKQYLASFALLVLCTQSFAHSPYIAPNSYWVQGEQTAILSAFAEEPFDAEFAISGFDFSVLTPKGQPQKLSLTDAKALSVATVETTVDGTYQVLGQRKSELKYAQVGKRWLRVMDIKSTDLPALEQRSFVLPSEITAKNKQQNVERIEEVTSFFSKNKTSPVHVSTDPTHLVLNYATHPNQLSTKTPLTLNMSLNSKPVQGLAVQVDKQFTQVGQQPAPIKLQSDAKGDVKVIFPAAGQYLITVTTPEQQDQQKLAPRSYRSIVTVSVND